MFISTATNTLDAKGRVSVPADFRAEVTGGIFDGIVIWPGVDGPYLEGGGVALLKSYGAMIDAMDPFDDVRLAFEHTLFGAAKKLSFDATGRVTLPKELSDHAGLSANATFIGLGTRFQIWDKSVYATHLQKAQKLAKESRHLMRPRKPGGVS